MKHAKKLSIFSTLILFSLILSLLFPINVLADDATPPPAETPEVVPPTEAPAATEAPVTVEPLPPLPAITEIPVIDQVPATAGEDNVELAAIVAAVDENEITLADTSGEPLVLAAQETSELLATGDPFFWDGDSWEGYTTTGTGCPANVNCHLSATPLQSAVSNAPIGATIYVASSAISYGENVIINTANLSFQGFSSINVNSGSNTPSSFTAGNATTTSITLNAVFGTTSGLFAPTVYVNAGGTIQDGVDLVAVDGTVYVASGIYQENVTIGAAKSGITIYGNPGAGGATDTVAGAAWNAPVVEGANIHGTGFNVNATNVTLIGLVIQNFENGIQLNASGNATFRAENNTIRGNDIGVFNANSVPGIELHYNVFVNNDFAIKNVITGGSQYIEAQNNYWGCANGPVVGRFVNGQWSYYQWSPGGQGTAQPIPGFDPATADCEVLFGDVDNHWNLKAFDWSPYKIKLNAVATSSETPPPTPTPTQPPTNTPTPTSIPTNTPTNTPTDIPTNTPTNTPTDIPTNTPTPTDIPTNTPTNTPTNIPTNTPTPTDIPTNTPTNIPTNTPTNTPTNIPTNTPTPTNIPTNTPTNTPTNIPTNTPTSTPTNIPTSTPTNTSVVSNATPTPVRPSVAFTGFVPVTGGEYHAIAAGIAHTCAITPEGGVQCWGNNDFGQLGDGTNTGSNVPVNVVGLEGGTTIVAGGNHTCVLSGGDVWCWGQNSKGQLGDGTSTDRNVPVKVLSSVVDITAGLDYTCAIMTYGQVMCWGNNDQGQLADGTKTDHATPTLATLISGISNVDAGQNKSCGLTSTGLLRCLNRGTPQEVGGIVPVTGGLPENSLDVAVNRFGPLVMALIEDGIPVAFQSGKFRQINNVSQAVDVDSGSGHVCTLIDNGTVKCWGANSYGQLGRNSQTSSSDPLPVLNISNAWQLAVGKNHACVLIVSSTPGPDDIQCWGLNTDGQLGNGTNVNSSVPVLVK